MWPGRGITVPIAPSVSVNGPFVTTAVCTPTTAWGVAASPAADPPEHAIVRAPANAGNQHPGRQWRCEIIVVCSLV
jgi:hypothetical protein